MSVSADPVFQNLTFNNTKWTALGIIGESVGFNGTLKKRDVAGYANITYFLLGDITITAGTVVNVEPGIVVKSNGAGIYVNGAFKAIGTALNKITFTSFKDDNFGNPNDTNGDGAASTPESGNWSTIRFQDTSIDTMNVLRYCQIKFGGASEYGGVTFYNAGGKIYKSIISDSRYYGIRCDGASDPTIDSSQIINCIKDPLAISLKANPKFPTFMGLTFTSNGSNGIRILEGTLSSNATLYKRDVAGIKNIAYVISSEVIISSNALLTIEPGVVIKFSDYWNSITVNGAIIANGTAQQKIIFTSIEDDNYGGDTNNDGSSSSPAKNNWGGITLNSSGLDSLNSFDRCEFYYGGWEYSSTSGLLRVNSCKAKINHSVFAHSQTSGIKITGSANPTIKNCDINNVNETPVVLSLFSKPVFDSITVSNAGMIALGVISETYSNDAVVPVRNFAGFNNVTYYFYGTSVVNSGTKITIPKGVVIKSLYTPLRVSGALSVEGTKAEPVVITSLKDDSYGNPKDTNGDGTSTIPSINSYSAISFDDVSNDENSSINYATIRYFDSGVTLQQASPKIRQCLFEKCSWGVVLNGVSKPVIDSCLFNNLSYAPMYISLASYPLSSEGNTIKGTTYKAIGIISETLTQDFSLGKHTFAGIKNIPYFFPGNYTVGTSVTLTIEPGVVCKFASGYGMTVRKVLRAVGGSMTDSTIVFTHIWDDYYGGDSNSDTTATLFSNLNAGNRWSGISFTDESIDQNCLLKHCIIRGAGYYWNTAGAINVTSASPSIINCAIVNNTNGIIASAASNPVINYCDIYNNDQFGINNVNKSFTIDARNNWWGNNSGPAHASNPGGTGQAVTDAVTFTPFLQSGSINPLAGDVSLNGQVQSYDASLILKYVVNPTGNPLNEIQRKVADVSSASGITAYDASLILQEVVGLIQTFPSEFNKKNSSSIEASRQTIALQKVSAGEAVLANIKTEAGKEISIPVSIKGMKGLMSVQMTLKYDPSCVEFSGMANTALSENMTVTSYNDKANGIVKIAAAGGKMLPEEGTILDLNFIAGKKLHGKINSEIKVQELLANETDMTSSAVSSEMEISGLPVQYKLQQNYPNPFNPSTTIKYELPDDNINVDIQIFNSLGQLVKTVVSGNENSGRYEIVWNGCDNNGRQVTSGIYICRIQAGKFTATRKMMMLK
jgi:hypothetical protein